MTKPLLPEPSPHTAYMRRWRAANVDAQRDYQQRYFKEYSTDPARRRVAAERTRAWKEAHPERAAISAVEAAGKRRAIKARVAVGTTDYTALLSEAAGVCALCRRALGDTWHFDHIVPLSRGGAHAQENLQVTHPECNARKHAKSEWQHLFEEAA